MDKAKIICTQAKEAQRDHGDILGGVDSARNEDVKMMLMSSSSASRDVTATPFDSEFGLRGSVMDLFKKAVEDQEDNQEEEEKEESRSEEDKEKGKTGKTPPSKSKGKLDESVLRCRRKFVHRVDHITTRLRE